MTFLLWCTISILSSIGVYSIFSNTIAFYRRCVENPRREIKALREVLQTKNARIAKCELDLQGRDSEILNLKMRLAKYEGDAYRK